MAFKKIDAPQHGILLQQLALIQATADERSGLEDKARELYARHHELHQELEKVLGDYERMTRQIRRKLPAYMLV